MGNEKTYGEVKRYFMSEDKKIKEDIIKENDSAQEDYTFVRETIKEKPPAFVRVLLKVGKLLGMGVAFGLGICLVIFIFNRDIRDVFTGDKKEDNKTVDSQAGGSGGKNDSAISEEADMSLDDKIKAQLAEVVVVYYSQEEDTSYTETQSSQETTAMYQGENLTADISDNKEIQTTPAQTEKNTEKETAKESSSADETTQSATNRQVEEKKYYTGVLIATAGDVFICVENHKINNGGDIFVSFVDGNYVEADVYGYDAINGLAVLRVYSKDIDEETKKSLKSVNLKNMDEMDDGDKLVYVGNPYGNGRLMYTGTLAGVDDGHCNYDTFFRGVITDIRNDDIQDGFIFDENGDIVAMVGNIDEKLTLGKNITGVCMEDIMFIVRSIIDGSSVKHIGVKGESVTDNMRELTGEDMPDGMYVTDVARDSSAYRSGIMVGDIVISAGDNEVKDLRDIQSLLEKTSENADITLVVKRKIGTGYSEFTIKVPVEASSKALPY